MTAWMKIVTEPRICPYLELIFDLAGVRLGVQPADVVVERAELTHRDGRVATQACFQDGVVHKHILLLHSQGREQAGKGRLPGGLSTFNLTALKSAQDLCCHPIL